MRARRAAPGARARAPAVAERRVVLEPWRSKKTRSSGGRLSTTSSRPPSAARLGSPTRHRSSPRPRGAQHAHVIRRWPRGRERIAAPRGENRCRRSPKCVAQHQDGKRAEAKPAGRRSPHPGRACYYGSEAAASGMAVTRMAATMRHIALPATRYRGRSDSDTVSAALRRSPRCHERPAPTGAARQADGSNGNNTTAVAERVRKRPRFRRAERGVAQDGSHQAEAGR